jgi:hypothetical protein
MRPPDWLPCKVEDIASPERNALVGGPFGSNLVSRDYTPKGVPVIRGQNMSMGRWVAGDFVFVSHEKADEPTLLSQETSSSLKGARSARSPLFHRRISTVMWFLRAK